MGTDDCRIEVELECGYCGGGKLRAIGNSGDVRALVTEWHGIHADCIRAAVKIRNDIGGDLP